MSLRGVPPHQALKAVPRPPAVRTTGLAMAHQLRAVPIDRVARLADGVPYSDNRVDGQGR